MSETPNCRVCSRAMFLLDEQDGRWYCYRDDQVYLSRQQAWIGSLPSGDQPRREWISRETGDAVVIGILVGFLHGLVIALEGNFIFVPLATERFLSGVSETQLALWNMMVAAELGRALTFGVIEGGVLGFLFNILKQRIPGSSTIRKAVVFAVILTVIQVAMNISAAPDPSAISKYGSYYSLVMAVTFTNSIIVNPILGFVFGYTLNRTSKTKTGSLWPLTAPSHARQSKFRFYWV